MRQRGFLNRKLVYWLLLAILSFSLSLSGLPLPSLAQTGSRQLPILDSQPQQVTEPEKPVSPSPTGLGLKEPQELEAFVDNFFNKEMSKTHVPGAVISVVKDGKLFFAKGYGYANLEKKIPVEADKTLFRVASLSKLFTATAAMQLYERGQLDLNADVNQYVDFELENPYSEPVTAARMMMHTDGTTVRRIGLAARTEAEMQPLGDYLADHMPPIVSPPGELYSYSSHSTALLGYVVEKISGTPFAEYIDKNILQPLEMRRSTFLQPLPPTLADNLAVGYQHQSGNFKPVPFLYLNIAPAAAMSTTATDMANFMIAHLLRDRYENSRILEEDTMRLMHKTHFAHHPKLPGTGYSFRERLENNIRMIGHLGSLRGYSSSLTLMPDQNIGIFIASNSFSGIHGKLLSQLLDHYFPVPDKPVLLKPLALTDEQLDRFTGTYRDMEYPRATFLKPSAMFKHINIKKGDNGTLVIQTPGLFFLSNPQDIKLIPVGPQLFQRANDDALTAFGEAIEDKGSNQIKFAFNPLWPKIGAYERVPWYETAWVQLGVLGFCVLVFLSAFFIWPIRPLIRRLRGKNFQIERQPSRAWLLAGLVGTLNLVFIIGLPLSLWVYGAWKLAYGVPVFAIAFFSLPLITTVLTLGLSVFTVLGWKNKLGSAASLTHYSLITLAALAFIPFLLYWNLLGFQF
ncbi:serine hydrolase domain-containing protein [Coleofasciculus sp. FACHB-1120]|uniref:serine hydrolase domain-containing protein n=1 Tax=Coleofasciculus sp. FACHB-1120 TaxID=2692783 RepID=UPI00168299C3|nr:serine hydrolase domain-containing protein [Coleofasciculus sp. FACHB-1120]MBD2744943.1 serine hydrolase [Coleofasciculus sp. FACHB-1120]